MQCLAGDVSLRRHGGGWLRRDVSGGQLSAEWLRTLLHYRKCVGVVRGLVPHSVSRRPVAVRSQGTGDGTDQSDEGRLVPVPCIVLQPLPCGGENVEYAR